MTFGFEYSIEKDLILKATRGVGFEDVIEAINKGNLIDDVANSSNRYPNQRILVVKIDEYVYAVPYVKDSRKKKIFLKTVYASRRLTKQYIKDEK